MSIVTRPSSRSQGPMAPYRAADPTPYQSRPAHCHCATDVLGPQISPARGYERGSASVFPPLGRLPSSTCLGHACGRQSPEDPNSLAAPRSRPRAGKTCGLSGPPPTRHSNLGATAWPTPGAGARQPDNSPGRDTLRPCSRFVQEQIRQRGERLVEMNTRAFWRTFGPHVSPGSERERRAASRSGVARGLAPAGVLAARQGGQSTDRPGSARGSTVAAWTR